ncbi:hypothetical protein RLIN73S_01584 [Rhodanobacter lindaniclasticus]
MPATRKLSTIAGPASRRLVRRQHEHAYTHDRAHADGGELPHTHGAAEIPAGPGLRLQLRDGLAADQFAEETHRVLPFEINAQHNKSLPPGQAAAWHDVFWTSKRRPTHGRKPWAEAARERACCSAPVHGGGGRANMRRRIRAVVAPGAAPSNQGSSPHALVPAPSCRRHRLRARRRLAGRRPARIRAGHRHGAARRARHRAGQGHRHRAEPQPGGAGRADRHGDRQRHAAGRHRRHRPEPDQPVRARPGGGRQRPDPAHLPAARHRDQRFRHRHRLGRRRLRQRRLPDPLRRRADGAATSPGSRC